MKNKIFSMILFSFAAAFTFGETVFATNEVGDGVSDQWIEDQGLSTLDWQRLNPRLNSVAAALQGFKSYQKVLGTVKEDNNQVCLVTVARKNSFEKPFYYFNVYFPATAINQKAYMIEPSHLDKRKTYSFRNESDGLGISFGINNGYISVVK